MDITNIHTGSFATRIGHVAARDVFKLLNEELLIDLEPFDEHPWWWLGEAGIGVAVNETRQEEVLDLMGEYVCKNQVEQGERLYRHACNERLIASIGNWADLTFSQRQPWETFSSTARQAFNELKAAQLAILDVRRAAAVSAPQGLKREDSIFEEEDDIFALRPEAVEALKLTGIYERGQEAERLRLTHAAEDKMRDEAEAYNALWDKFGGDPSKFDHDGNGKPGGSKPKRPRPLSAGETVTQPPRNVGGRGNKKTP